MRGVQELEPRGRILTLMALMLGAYLVLLGRLAYWQVLRHGDMSRLAAVYHDDTITLPAVRGDILDRNGALLVTNTPVFSIFASPDQISAADRQKIADQLAPVLDLPPDDIMSRLATTRKFVYLARRMPAAVAQQLDRLRLPGIGKIAETQRSYVDGGVPGTTLAANLLGFANDQGVGNYGVEGYYDKSLHGQDGFEATVRDLANQPIVLSDRQRRDPVNGMTLQLSLDSTIQVVAERALADGVQKYQAESGSLIIMEPNTGRIVAWADVPSYDANQFATTPTDQFRDPIVSDLYEPGSVMKVVTLSGSLETHAITPDYRFNETGTAVVGGYAIHNWDGRAHGMVTMTQVLENSLNVGAIKAEQLEGAANFYQYLQKFGIGATTGIDLAGETSAPLADLSKWKASQLATASFGQGVDTTAIEMLSAIDVVATGGNLVWPHVVDAMIDDKGVRHPVQPRVVRQVISAKTALQMQQMMVGVVEHGSGFAAKIDGFKNRIAGKTGTASIPENGSYSKDQTIGSFVGFVPADHPQFIMLVITRKPKILFEGAYVAAPIWKTVASALITQWQIAP
ncbi:MAG TPA: penicillin-binding protein 2 [Candidatus Dormibacteraeota bacterium]|nr:penicillin-binding protein 2 [Candidatus Dormibacteraeota bacterium]